MEWKACLMDRSRREAVDTHDQMLLTSLSLGIKPLGTVFGKPGKFYQSPCVKVIPVTFANADGH